MRRIALALLAVVVSLVAVGHATAKTVTVSITKNGYVPSAVSIAQGDTVQFTNADTVVHQVTLKSTAGVTCSPNPLVVQPGQSGTCTFAEAGNYAYSDPNVKGNTFRGTITVTAAAASLSLAAKPQIVVYGGKTTLSGVLSTQQTGQNVDVYAQACGAAAATKVATVQTTTGGAFTALVQPLNNTVYSVRAKNLTSSAVTVKVRPRLRLGKIAPQRYSLRVTAAESLAGKVAAFQRYNGTLGRWVTIKRVVLKANASGVAPTVVSSVTFRSTVARRLKVRVVLPQAQVGTCYLAGTSNTILT